MRKPIEAGKPLVLRTSKAEQDLILLWLNMQDNIMDSLRFLMENEIRENGLRNIQQHIPAKRPDIVVGEKIESELIINRSATSTAVSNFQNGLNYQAVQAGEILSNVKDEIQEQVQDHESAVEKEENSKFKGMDDSIDGW